MKARDGTGGCTGLAEAIEAGGNVARAAQCDVRLRETVEVLAEEVHVAVLAPLRQPFELAGRHGRHLGEHPKVKGFLGVREAEPHEAIEGVLQAAVTSRAGSQAQGASQFTDLDLDVFLFVPEHGEPSKQQGAGRAEYPDSTGLRDVGMIETEPGSVDLGRWVRHGMQAYEVLCLHA